MLTWLRRSKNRLRRHGSRSDKIRHPALRRVSTATACTSTLRSFDRSFRGFRTQSAHHGFGGRAQDAADAQQGTQRDRLACFNPLPVAHGIAKGNHVFLAVAPALAQRLDTLPEGSKEFIVEFGVFGQQCSCTASALDWPRCI
jgi:hypothetical protein